MRQLKKFPRTGEKQTKTNTHTQKFSSLVITYTIFIFILRSEENLSILNELRHNLFHEESILKHRMQKIKKSLELGHF